MTLRIGIDVGGVLRKPMTHGAHADYLDTPPSQGALSTVRWMIKYIGREHVFIISKCPQHMDSAVRSWLEANEFLAAGGIDPTHLYFCRERTDKAPIAKKLGINYFIDDRAEVLIPMKHAVERRILFGPSKDSDIVSDGEIRRLSKWSDVRKDINMLIEGYPTYKTDSATM